MAKLLVYYSQNKNRFKTKITRRYFINQVGYINQFDERLIKVIDTNDLRLKKTPKFLRYLYKKIK